MNDFKMEVLLYLNVKTMTAIFYSLLIISVLNIKVTMCTKCSYSFIINEMDPNNCPCLVDQSGDSDVLTKSWIPEPSFRDNPDDIQSDEQRGSLYPANRRDNTNETRELRASLSELQKQYNSMYSKMKDLEIKMYKESMNTLQLQHTIDQQIQALKDYSYITERLKQSMNQAQWDLDEHKLKIRGELDLLQDSVDSNSDALQKHNKYLTNFELRADTASSGRHVKDTITRQATDTKQEKHIAVQSAPHVYCDALSRNATKYKDCEELYERGHRQSGVYYITPQYAPCPIPVYCDMHTDGGGWLVLQRRQDGSQNFNRNWTDYRHGFGDLNGEYWLGNDNIFLLTNQASYKLRIDLWDFNKTHKYAQYMYFNIGGERDKYRLMVMNFTGNVQDGLSYHNGQLFSTPDEDNDSWDAHHCSKEWSGGWWFDKCWFVVLNGWYFDNSNVKYKGIAWNHWKSEQLMKTEMKIKTSDYI